MSEANRWETLKALMKQEADLMALLGRDEETLRASLGDKDWFTVEQAINRLQEYSHEIERIEQKRHTLWEEIRSCLGQAQSGSFSDALTTLPSPLKDDLEVLYRNLRRESGITRSRLEGLRKIAESRTAMIRGILEDLIPDSRGNIYGQQGRPLPAMSGSLLLNTCH